MKPGRTLLIIALLVLGVIIYLNKCRNTPQSLMTANPGQQPVMVSAVVVKPSTISDKINSSGTVLANEEVELRNEIPGRVIHIYFKEGSRVNKGELLVKIFDTDLQAQLKKLTLQKTLAEKNETRQKDLLAINGISQQDYDEALNALDAVKADIDLTKAQIEKTEIRAPFSGVVGLKSVSEGAYLSANTMIATMQEINPVKIDFTVPERYMNSIHPADEISFSVEGMNETFKGSVYAIEPKVDLSTRSIAVRALCPNKENKIFPGAFARIELSLSEIKDALMIPTQSLIPELKGQKVFISKEGKAAPVKVQTGLRNDSTIQITKGLQVGDTVIVTGIMQLRPDVPLRITSVK